MSLGRDLFKIMIDTQREFYGQKNNITATVGVILPCRICHQKVLVGDTQDFKEKETKKQLTSYYSPKTGRLIGISEGTGDTFECLPCHAMAWKEAKQPAASQPSRKEEA